MTERKVLDAKALNKTSKVIFGAIVALQCKIHDHLMNLVVRAQEHGDVTPIEYFVSGMSQSQRTTTIEAWLAKYTPITKTKDKWHMKRNWKKDDFKIEVMEDNPYWTLGKEAKPKTMSLEEIIKMVKGLPERITRTVKKQEETGEELFKGDSQAAIAIVTDLGEYLESKVSKLTAQQRGKVLNQPVSEPVTETEVADKVAVAA